MLALIIQYTYENKMSTITEKVEVQDNLNWKYIQVFIVQVFIYLFHCYAWLSFNILSIKIV
jgi:hypothetical protein